MPASVVWTAPSPVSLFGFIVVVLFVCVAFLLAIRHSAPPAQRPARTSRAAAGLVCWLGLTGLYSWAGLPARGLPFLVFLLAGSNLGAIALALSPVGKKLASTTPLVALVGFQSFRFPLEIILHAWAAQGVIPESMTWSGENLDVITGIAALTAVLLMLTLPRLEKYTAAVFGLIGFGLLINVARVAILSSPGPQRVFGDPPLLLAMHVPEVWIIAVCVAGAFFGHIVLFRALWMRW